MRPMWMVAAAVLFTSIAVPQQSEAQAGELGSPVPPGTEVTRPDGSSTITPAEQPTVPPPPSSAPPSSAAPPSSYEQLDVPPPPGSDAGVRYPGVEPRQRPLATDSGLRIPSGIATRLRALDSDFQVLSMRGSSVVGGIISILAGGLSIALGVVNDVSASSFGYGMSPYLYVYGGSGVLRGILELALQTNASGPAITFAHMPMLTMEEVQLRLDYGERELADLANRSLIARILDGSLSIAVGLAIVPINFAVSGWEDFEENPLAWIAIATAAISVISGVITLVSTSEAERRWAAYRQLRDQLEARGDPLSAADAGGESAGGESAGGESEDELQELSQRGGGASFAPVVAGGSSSGIFGISGTF